MYQYIVPYVLILKNIFFYINLFYIVILCFIYDIFMGDFEEPTGFLTVLILKELYLYCIIISIKRIIATLERLMNENPIPIYVLSPMDILDFAVQFEQKSVYFYENISKYIKNIMVKGIFAELAAEEMKHIKAFQNMIILSRKEQYDKISLPEHIKYLHDHINTNYFSREMLSGKIKMVRDVESAFEFATSIELDQILFYNEIKNILAEKDRGLIEEIVNEERKHFIKIMQMKQIKGF
jgi:rubrerythrin